VQCEVAFQSLSAVVDVLTRSKTAIISECEVRTYAALLMCQMSTSHNL
jgi:hypothetical protein